MEYRIETDSMGEVKVPSWAFYGAQTQRAVDNFKISDLVMPMEVIRALALIKWAAAKTNEALGLLDSKIAGAIADAALRIVNGEIPQEHFPVDVFQTGSGTSTNMNVNEVIANLAIAALGGQMGSKHPVHPNDHVNKGQSSNDTIPTAIHIAAVLALDRDAIPALKELHRSLAAKAQEFDDVLKIGRTHLQDATPIRLGQEFSGYARQVELGIRRLEQAREGLLELALGGTAVGTGVNTHPEFARRTIALIAERTGIPFREAENHFEAQAAKDAVVFASGALKTVATSLMKIANDIRWLGSGPRCGLGEILLPELQPGSSIMPGKVNPVIPEAVIQAAAQVTGNDLAITIGGQWGNFELNVMMPMMAHNLLQSIALVASAARAFKEKCIDGIQADRKRCESMIEQSLALVTPLAKVIGYDRAAEIAKEAYQTGRTVRDLAREKGVLPEDQLAKVLDPKAMTRPSA
ncbi:MAG: class II fumarate hydratase [Clostridia bacterium]|nr:aspartate ammonia-lyase [Bacillota bacterium]MBO2520934.1 aspartate ammonia-lyase [Bacillota bacterium]